MKNIIYRTLLPAMLWSCSVVAQTPTTTHIDINNVDAIVSSCSDLFWDFNMPGFEVPKGSGKHSLFAGGIWIGGYDSGNNLHLAAQTYRQTGYDFQPGPIDTINNQPASPTLWNTSWKLDQADVQTHIQQVGTTGYVVPANIAAWPGYDATLGRVLAPFADVNGNAIYDPQNGDYPFFPGDQAVYSIFNDMRTHTESGCSALGMEIHRTTFAFDQPSNPALDNSIFTRYDIKNFSSNDYHDVYIVLWTDIDLGNYMDDYIGTDIGLDMAYGYNGDSDDEGPSGYGLNPPAVGIHFLNASMNSSLVYDNINGVPNGNPTGCNDYYNYSQAIWANGSPVTYGGNGMNPGNPVTTYMHSGNTDPVNFPVFGAWTELTAGNAPGDRRVMNAIGPLTIPAGGYYTFDAAYTWSRAASGGPLASLSQLQSDVGQLRVLYNSGALTGVQDAESAAGLTLYPNPASEYITLVNPNPGTDSRIYITDMTGKRVLTRENESGASIRVDVSGLAKGIYIVSSEQGKTRTHSRLVIQ